MKLYRGFTNIHEMYEVMIKNTAGGLEMVEGNLTSYKNNIINQKTTGGEGFPTIYYIETLRPFIEYTSNEEIALRFGLLGVIEIEVSDKFLVRQTDTISNDSKGIILEDRLEQGVFLLSDAPITITRVSHHNFVLQSIRDYNIFESIEKIDNFIKQIRLRGFGGGPINKIQKRRLLTELRFIFPSY